MEFLRAVLGNGPVETAQIERAARHANFLAKDEHLAQSVPLCSACTALGIITTKAGMGDQLIWSLPKLVPLTKTADPLADASALRID
jgi:hypothetical protein